MKSSIATVRGQADSLVLSAASIIEQVRDHAMLLLDRHGRVANWNAGVGEILRWPREDWIGQPVLVIFTPEDVAAGVPQQELQQAQATGRSDDDRWLLRRDGERFYASGAVTRIDDAHGELIGYLKILRDTTPTKRAQEERERLLLAERVARADAEGAAAELTAALHAIPEGVYFGTETGITRCNATALQMLGAHSTDDLNARIDELGRKFRVRHTRDGPLVAPEDLPFVRALRGEASVLETWATNVTTGEDVFIRGTAAPIEVGGRIVGAVAVNSDLTERLQLEERNHQLVEMQSDLRARDEQLRALTLGVRDYAIFTVGLDGMISSWHIGAQLMKGYTAEEAIGMPFANLFLPSDRDSGRPSQEMEIAAATGEYKGDGLRLRKDGSTFDAAVVLTALRGARGELLGYLKLTQDVTDRKRQERERDEMLRNAEIARAEAERASRSKNEFLATISHELRTPLGAILGWAQVLQRGGAQPPGLEQGLAAITRNARVQVQLIEDLLDMNRIESGQLRLEMQPVELTGVVAAAVDAVLPSASGKQIDLRTVFDAGATLVSGDAGRLQQIVWNLLTNAVKFTPPGGSVTVALSARSGSVEIAVSDTGQGIDREFLTLVFDRFQQQDATTTRRHGGLGLGLAIVRELVQLHGGTVRADSAGSGQGATFTVSLPALAPLQPAVRAVSAGLAATDDRLQGLTVLLIDDEPDAREMAAHVLQDAGARVLSAGSAIEGFDLLRAHRPQVIVSDIGMPLHDGYDFVRWVRALDPAHGGRTPAAAFTAYSRPEDRSRALSAGFQSHLIKPVEPSKLVAAVAELANDAVAPLDPH